MSTSAKLLAEFAGTFCLVFLGCAAALFSANYSAPLGIGFLGVGLAFGVTVMAMVYALGHISGCHLNPAVSIGLCAAKRFRAAELPGYIIAQTLGAIAGALILYIIGTGQQPTFEMGKFACNGYGWHSPLNFSMWSCFMAEFVFTGIFLFIIVGSTSEQAPKGMAGIAIGLGLTVLHLGLIPITNCSLNPARSTGTALILAGFGKTTDHSWAIGQLWLFWLAPILGGLCGGLFFRFIESQGEMVATPKKPKRGSPEYVNPNAPETFELVDSPSPMPKPSEHKPH